MAEQRSPLAPEALDRLAAETDAAIMWPGSHGNTKLFVQLRPVIDELRKAWADNVALMAAARAALAALTDGMDDVPSTLTPTSRRCARMRTEAKRLLRIALEAPHPGQPLLDRLERLEAVAVAVRNKLDSLLLDEDLTDEKLREAADGMLPRLADMARAALDESGPDAPIVTDAKHDRCEGCGGTWQECMTRLWPWPNHDRRVRCARKQAAKVADKALAAEEDKPS